MFSIDRLTMEREPFSRAVRAAGLAIALMTSSASGVLAQSNAADAAIDGYVRDSDGGVLPGATLTTRNARTNIQNSATTDERGHYRFPLLQIGEYELTVSLDGFAAYTQRGIVLDVGRQVRLDVTLSLRALAETVTVVADAAVVDATQAAIRSVVNERAMRTLPIVSRNVYNMNLLAPGVKGLPSSGFGTTQMLFGLTSG